MDKFSILFEFSINQIEGEEKCFLIFRYEIIIREQTKLEFDSLV